MIARNSGGGNGARPRSDGRQAGRAVGRAADSSHQPWEGRFPAWLRRAAAEGRRAGKFPKVWSTSAWGVLDGIRELSEGLHLVDRWGCQDNRLIFEAYVDLQGGQVMQRLLSIADALGCWVAVDPEASRHGSRPAGERWTAFGHLTRIEFGRLVPGSASPRYIRYPSVQLASGAHVHVDDRGLLVHGRQPGGIPSRQDINAVCQWLTESKAKPVSRAKADGELLQWAMELELDRPIFSLGACIVAAHRMRIPIAQWGPQNPFDVCLGLSIPWMDDQLSRLQREGTRAHV